MPRLIGSFVYLAAVINVVSGLVRPFRGRLRWLSEMIPGAAAIDDAAAAAIVVSGILLALLAHALRRRKYRAWRAVLVLTVASVALHTVRLHVVPLLLSVGLLYLLLRYRKEFYAEGDPTTRWRALWWGLGLLVASTVIGVGMISLYDRRVIGGWPGLWPALQHVWLGMTGINGDLTFKGGEHRFDDFLSAVLLGLGLMTLLVPIGLALRATRPRPELSDADDARLRDLLERSPDSLGYFNLRRDKSIVWSESGKAAIAYRVLDGVMLASGDPVGDPEAWPGAISRFLEEADRHAWTP
ncbi:MAG: phosphatidylglycerol lysyltransferase domain-containing protein, partial [Dermatophilaceae bacterium]